MDTQTSATTDFVEDLRTRVYEYVGYADEKTLRDTLKVLDASTSVQAKAREAAGEPFVIDDDLMALLDQRLAAAEAGDTMTLEEVISKARAAVGH